MGKIDHMDACSREEEKKQVEADCGKAGIARRLA